ncbi:hypothetical protein C2845_PM10G15390 [Panicum miliaceum]|uniref:Uncharacterized protein n=1 Tax=Panicum miliaceum TaxID=4540 RepID=A0A3L6PCB9_PANMI|nr:hypothetical protein C2845_PM10G15390 [Panicum miliaceum]
MTRRLPISLTNAECCNSEGRPGLLLGTSEEAARSYDPNGLTNTSANATGAIVSPSDESKVTLIFCIQPQICVHPAPCYCCVQPKKCYYTMEKCRANCLTCSPKCASRPPAMEEDRALHAVMTEPEP